MNSLLAFIVNNAYMKFQQNLHKTAKILKCLIKYLPACILG